MSSSEIDEFFLFLTVCPGNDAFALYVNKTIKNEQKIYEQRSIASYKRFLKYNCIRAEDPFNNP